MVKEIHEKRGGRKSGNGSKWGKDSRRGRTAYNYPAKRQGLDTIGTLFLGLRARALDIGGKETPKKKGKKTIPKAAIELLRR